MASGPGSTGRSPFPPSRQGRTRVAARLSLGDRSSLDDSTIANGANGAAAGSPMFAAHGAGLSFGTTASGWSPHKSTTNAQYNKTRFFDETTNNNNESTTNDSGGGTTATATGTVDGIPVDHLRSLALTALLQSPSQACFYASLLYSKTASPADALLLAQADLSNSQYAACLRVLEESGLLLSEYPWEALLLACHALAANGEWTTLLELLEDACRFPDHAASNTTPGGGIATGFRALAQPIQSQPLDDNDDYAWETLKQTVSALSSSSALASSNDDATGTIHPLARVCCWRGRAYQEAGHGIRAAVYWKRALQMDVQCQEAWEMLLSKHVVTPRQAYELVQDLDFQGLTWLRALYLARIELTPQQDGNLEEQGGGGDVKETGGGGDAAAAAEESHSSFAMHGALDASSIQMSSPMPTFATPVAATAGDGMDLHPTLGEKPAGKSSAMLQDVDAAFDKLWNEYKLQHCPQVLAMAARRSYRRCEWKAALKYCQELAQLDPALTDAAFCFVATLVILGHKRALFRLAHEWVDAAPKSAQSWFAVGAYYFCCERYHVAQRHFCRATRLDPQCTEAWIAFGCSFAACDESDQALASFRAAQRLSPGEHSSLLYMGMEYVRTNHLVLAQYFLQSALSASGGDPLCLHELGVLAFQKGEHAESIPLFQQALTATVGGDHVEETIGLCYDPYWEPTLFNLGHSLRKTRQLSLAAMCFERCVSLCPDKFSAYSALAFTKHMLCDLDAAIDFYHQALSCKPDDPFSTEMLNRALREALTTTLRLSDDDQVQPSASSELSPNVKRRQTYDSFRNDSAMSEEMESDVDMSGAD